MDQRLELELNKFATEIRIATIKEIAARGFGHIGGSLSVVDALAVLYGNVMKIDPANPAWDGRDVLVMSKGHAGPAVYATLALKGYFPMEDLYTLNQPGTCLPSHCDRKLTPGIDMTTGSLGQGISTGIGMALGLKLQDKPNHVFLFAGDGEINEGQAWEGFLFCNHHKLDNLTLFLDKNGKQLDGPNDEVLDLGDVEAKMNAFGFYTQSINGNNVGEVYDAVQNALKEKGRPSMIILNTIKGAGLESVENTKLNHHVNVSQEEAVAGVERLEAKLGSIEEALKSYV